MVTEYQELPVAPLIKPRPQEPSFLMRRQSLRIICMVLHTASYQAVPNGRCQTPALSRFWINTVVKFVV